MGVFIIIKMYLSSNNTRLGNVLRLYSRRAPASHLSDLFPVDARV